MVERSSASTQSPAHGAGCEFKTQVFYVFIDCVTANIRREFKAAEKLNYTFCVLWKYGTTEDATTEDATVERQARALFEKYRDGISEGIIDEMKDFKKIHSANISLSTLGPFDLLIKLHELDLETLFSNVRVMLRIFLHHFSVRGIR